MLHSRPGPTTRPRYTITDTGEIAGRLDAAQRRWPDVQDRKELLLRLAAAGSEAIAAESAEEERGLQRRRQREALRRAPELLDADVLLSDAAWR